MQNRILKVTISLPTGEVWLTQELNLKVRIHKAALALQSRATIDVTGLTTTLRERLLSNFTAWHKRKVDTRQISQDYINVKVEAGYLINGNEQTSVVFIGQIVLCEPTSPPPDIGVRITCFTQQIDRTRYITSDRAAETISFRDYVLWAGKQMNLRVDCKTSYDGTILKNPGRAIFVVSALLIDIQTRYRPDVAAFIDDDVLVVRDRNAIVNPDEVSFVNEFIGTPMWTEWGVNFTCMFDTSIRLAQASQLLSKMNPGVNGKYVNMELDYDLCSRDRPFYVTVGANPPA